MSIWCQGILPFLCCTVLSIRLLFAKDTQWRFPELPVTVASRRQENEKGGAQICSEVPPNSFPFHLSGVFAAGAQSKSMLLNVHLHMDGFLREKRRIDGVTCLADSDSFLEEYEFSFF